jgi:hypothetical protein
MRWPFHAGAQTQPLNFPTISFPQLGTRARLVPKEYRKI